MVEEEPLNAAFTVVAGRAVVATVVATVEETEEDAFVSPATDFAEEAAAAAATDCTKALYPLGRRLLSISLRPFS